MCTHERDNAAALAWAEQWYSTPEAHAAPYWEELEGWLVAHPFTLGEEVLTKEPTPAQLWHEAHMLWYLTSPHRFGTRRPLRLLNRVYYRNPWQIPMAMLRLR